MNIFKKENLTPKDVQINRLKEEIRNCEKMMRRTEMMFDMSTDDNLIEARIYEMKSLVKHHDYLMATLKELMLTEEKTAINA